jgi:cystathionine beta-lyase
LRNASHETGLTDHPGLRIQARQAIGNGAVISFTTGEARLSQLVVDATRLFEIAVSFGSVGSALLTKRVRSKSRIAMFL